MSKRSGFTLIELLVVISIIAILVAVGTVSYQRTNKIARDGRRKADLEQIRQALETYRSENGTYPDSSTWTTDLSPDYINTLPQDPKNGGYTYVPGSSPITTYDLCAYLEIDPSGSLTGCAGQSCGTESCNYEVSNP